MAPPRPISELATIIERNARSLEDGLKGTAEADFSVAFGAELQAHMSPSLEAARSELLETVDELRVRVAGPLGYLIPTLLAAPTLLGVFSTLYMFDIASHVPLSEGGEISYRDLASRCGIPEDETRRLVQAAIAFHVFEEAKPNVSVKHNALSSALAATQIKEIAGFLVEEQALSFGKLAESMRRYPGSGEPGHAAAVLAAREQIAIKQTGVNEEDVPDPSKTYFEYMADDPERVARFRSIMGFTTKIAGFKATYFIDSVPWADKSQCPETIADVGGAGGELCQQILRRFPNIKKATILDLPEVIADVKAPEDLEGRLGFLSYNFFAQKVTHQADAYIFRHIFHDWSDKYCAKILRNLVPALKKGTRIWISDTNVPDLSEGSHMKDQFTRSMDMFMMSGFNAKERNREGWEGMLAGADERFSIVSIVSPKGGQDSVIEVVFDA